jgi:DNA polymerase III subunit gamma/tau
MSYIALYRKWRPSIFEDVVEQEHVVKTLKHSVVSGRIAHAYLFCGTRGTGKTTMAKIFSRAINCLNPNEGDPCNKCAICKGILSESILDVIEIDAASNNSVDNVREIRDEVIYAPSQAKYKVYIIDEVHMLSSGAFNALLKTLEEPPSHVVFILATTDPHKLPATILSRCQRYDFRRITVESIMSRLNKITEDSGVILQNDAARLIAKLADGALRDAISILDQCISLGNNEISYTNVLSVVGIVNDEFISNIVDAVNNKNIKEILTLVENLVMEGKDITQFVADLVYYFRNLLLCKLSENTAELIETSPETLIKMKTQISFFEHTELMMIIKDLSAMESGLKWASHPRILLEVSLIKLCDRNFSINSGDLASRVASLENKINNGNFNINPGKHSNVNAEETPVSYPSKATKATDKPSLVSVKEPDKIIDNSNVLENWDKIIIDLKNSGRVLLYTNLLGSKAIEIDNKFIGIIFGSGNSFNKMLVSKTENLEVVEAAVSKKIGREIRIKCLSEGDMVEGQKAPSDPVGDEFMEKAKLISDRLNMPMNIIDE